jgi:hypothetical protein
MPDLHLHSEYNAEIEKADKTRFMRYFVARVGRGQRDRIENEFMLEQALAFYKASKYSDFY